MYLYGRLLALPSRLMGMNNLNNSEVLLFCLCSFLPFLFFFFFCPQANEADQKAAQVAQDEVSKKSNVCGIPLLVETAKPRLSPLTL